MGNGDVLIVADEELAGVDAVDIAKAGAIMRPEIRVSVESAPATAAGPPSENPSKRKYPDSHDTTSASPRTW